MKKQSRNKPSQTWRRPDHNLAVATIALMAFLLIAGMTAWLLGEQPSTAGPAPAVAHSNSAKK